MTGRQGRGRKKLLDDPKKKTGYCKLKEEAMGSSLWIRRFGGDDGPVVRQARGLNKYLAVRDSSVK